MQNKVIFLTSKKSRFWHGIGTDGDFLGTGGVLFLTIFGTLWHYA